MLLLLFRVGPDRYAIDTSEIVEVLPMVEWKQVPQVPQGVAGIFNRRGVPVPLVDLGLMLYGQAARPRWGTRIIVVNYGVNWSDRRIGLLAEEVTETIRRGESDFTEPTVSSTGTVALGRVTEHNSSMIQLVHPANLLSNEVIETLYASSKSAA